jgi:hypothetical protein
MAEFEYRQAQEIRDACQRHGVRYLFIGKSAALLLGFPDTTQDADLFVDRSPENCAALIGALRDLGFSLSEPQVRDIERGKDFVQLKNGPFDVDLIFAPDGIERFEEAWKRHVEVEGFPVCHIDDVIASKTATHRQKDMETLPRLRSFREYWLREQERKA